MSQVSQDSYTIWRDGRLVEWGEATIHIMSHVVHYGSGVFEGVRAYDTPEGPAIFRLREHMRRLIESCKIYRLPLRHSLEELCQACIDTVAANSLRSAYIRPVVIRTGNSFAVVPDESVIETFVIARPAGTYLGDEGFRNGVDVGVSSWRRPAPDTHPAMAKASGNYLNAQLALMEAKRHGHAEAIMLDSFGFVSEGTGENLFVVRDGALHTAPLSAGILHGITRDSVIRLAREKGIEIRVEPLPREALYTADEMFFSGTAVEITPVRSVDALPVGRGKPGPITVALQSEFMGIAEGRIPDRFGWRTLVPQSEKSGV